MYSGNGKALSAHDLAKLSTPVWTLNRNSKKRERKVRKKERREGGDDEREEEGKKKEWGKGKGKGGGRLEKKLKGIFFNTTRERSNRRLFTCVIVRDIIHTKYEMDFIISGPSISVTC